MRKSMKGKKTKVPKLTEAEYTAYIASLKTDGEGESQAASGVCAEEKTNAMEK